MRFDVRSFFKNSKAASCAASSVGSTCGRFLLLSSFRGLAMRAQSWMKY